MERRTFLWSVGPGAGAWLLVRQAGRVSGAPAKLSTTAKQSLAGDLAKWCDLSDVADLDGVAASPWWQVLTPSSEILAIHAALLPDGRVLFFGGSQYLNPPGGPSDNPPYSLHVNSTRVWNPTTDAVTNPGSPSRPNNPGDFHDMFCGGQAFLPDGRLMVAGGFAGIFGFRNTGPRDTSIYNPATNTWFEAPLMNDERGAATTGGGRWYPTVVTMANGKLAMMLGMPIANDTRWNNDMVEVYDAATNTWTDQGPDADVSVPITPSTPIPTYPRLHVLPDGKIFSASPFFATKTDVNSARTCQVWDPISRFWQPTTYAPADDHEFDNWVHLSTTVLLPLRAAEDYRAKVLTVGAVTPRVIDFGAATPAWTATSARGLTTTRWNCNALLLPDGKVLVVGGSDNPGTLDNPALEAELYDPVANSWQTLEAAAVPRQYHAVAVVLSDGRVWTAGTNKNCQPLYNASDPDGLDETKRETRMEVFTPPYLRAGPRPTISSAPATINPSATQTFNINTPQGNTVSKVTLLRCGSNTHGFDADQRCIELAITARTGNSVTVTRPPDNRIAPPGPYFLFVIAADGTPSLGRAITVNVVSTTLGTPAGVAAGAITDVFWGDAHSSANTQRLNGTWGKPTALNGLAQRGSQMASDPSPVTTSANVVDTFWRGIDGAIWHRWLVWGTWWGPGQVTTTAGGAPKVVGHTSGRVDAFWRGTNNQLWRKTYLSGTGWGGDTDMDGGAAGTLASDPSPVITDPSIIDVYWRDNTNNLSHRYFVFGSWWGPEQLTTAGTLASAPRAVGHPDGRIDVFWRRNDNQLIHRPYIPGSGWQAEQALGSMGNGTTEPSPTISTAGVIDVFWRDASGRLQGRRYTSGSWGAQQQLTTGGLASAPAAVGQSGGRIDVFWRGTDGVLWRRSYVSGTWQAATAMSGRFSY